MQDETAERDFGMLWSILIIVLTIAVGCGVVAYIEGHTVVDYEIESGLQEFEQKFSAATAGRPVASVSETVRSPNYTMVLQ